MTAGYASLAVFRKEPLSTSNNVQIMGCHILVLNGIIDQEAQSLFWNPDAIQSLSLQPLLLFPKAAACYTGKVDIQ